jgi:hypothetical protein
LEVLWNDDPRYGDLNLSEIDLKSFELTGGLKKLDIFRGGLADGIISSDSNNIVIFEDFTFADSNHDFTEISLFLNTANYSNNKISKAAVLRLKGNWEKGDFFDQEHFTIQNSDGKLEIVSIEDLYKNHSSENNPEKLEELKLRRSQTNAAICSAVFKEISDISLNINANSSKYSFLARDRNTSLWGINDKGKDSKIIYNIKNSQKALLKDSQSLVKKFTKNEAGDKSYTVITNLVNWFKDIITIKSDVRCLRPDQKLSDVKPAIFSSSINLRSFKKIENNDSSNELIETSAKDDLITIENESLKITSGHEEFKIPYQEYDIRPFPQVSFSPDKMHFLIYGSGMKNHSSPVDCYTVDKSSSKTNCSLIHSDDLLTATSVSLEFYPFIVFVKPGFIAVKRFGSNDIISKWGKDSTPGYDEQGLFAINLKERRIAVLGDDPNRFNLFEIAESGDLKHLTTVKLSEKAVSAVTPDYFYAFRGDAIKEIHFVKGLQAYPFEQFDLRLNRPDIVLDRLGAPKEAIEAAKTLREKRLKKMNVTEEMLQPDFHLPEVALTSEVPSTTSSDQIDLKIKATDDKYPLERLRVYVNNVPINGTEGESLRDQKTQSLERTIPIKLAAGRNKIQVSVLNSAGAESLYANAEVSCTAERPKPKLYAVALGVSQYDRPEWCLKYAAKDATDLIGKLKVKAGSSYSEVKPLLLTDKEVTKESAAKIKQFLSTTTIDDTVLIFMAGHGLLDDKYDYYFGTTDIDPDKPSERGMPYEAIDTILAEVPSLKKALLMDTCHAGELDDDEKKELATSDGKGTLPAGSSTAADYAIKGTVAMRAIGTRGMQVKAVEGAKGKSDWYEKLQDMFVDLRRGSGATVISSSQGAEYAFESSEQSNGLFTYALMEALDGKATPNKDGQITISAIGDYVKKRVQDLTKGKQNPNLRGVNLEEDFTLGMAK